MTRLTSMIPSAWAAKASICTGWPSSVVPICTTCMDERMGQPTACSVMPRPSNSSSWPWAVAPPWLPMAGTKNGFAPASRSRATSAPKSWGIRSMPRLPAVMAISMPGRTPSMTWVRLSSSARALGRSVISSRSNFCRTGTIRGSGIPSTI